jgi:hypothetical protein
LNKKINAASPNNTGKKNQGKFLGFPAEKRESVAECIFIL